MSTTVLKKGHYLTNHLMTISVPVLAVLFSFVIGAIAIASMGTSVIDAGVAFWNGAFGNAYVISASLNRAVVLGLVGLGFVFAARAGLTNVGGEGQIAIGGIVSTAVCLNPSVVELPFGFAYILPLLIATMAGGLWGALPGYLKVRVGTNEVISTLLLSFIGIWLLYWCVQSESLLRQPMTTSATLPESLPIPMATQVPLLTGSYASPVTLGLPIALIIALIVGVLLSRSIFGFNLKAVGLNSVAATRSGISYKFYTIIALFVAGALGGLAGALMLQGEQYSLKAGFSSGYGFDGLVVGLLARNSVLGVIAAALLFGFMRSGGITMEMTASVPSALGNIIQGLIVVSIAGAAYYMDRRSSK